MARSRKKKWWFLGLLVVVAVGYVMLRGSGPKVAKGSWLAVDVDGSYAEAAPDGLLERFIEERKVLVTLLSNLDKAAHDDRINGVLLRIGSIESGWAQTSEIRDALASVKASGKRVIAFMRGDSPSANKEYYLASVADRVYLAPGGAPMLNGLAANFFFLGGMWEKADIDMEVEQIREYKTFGDMLVRRQMTPQHREMANWILDSVNAEFIGTIAQSRGMSEDQVRGVIDACPSSPDAFVEAGLADGVLFADQVEDEIGGGHEAKLVKEEDYTNVEPKTVGLGGGPKIAVVYASGTIAPGKSGGRSVFGVTVGAKTLGKALKDAAEDADVHAIVLRIDSPGGSATASDDVWRSAREARATKPLIVSMGDTAASGGYYMAAAADRIIADPMTLTGSIGVVFFKPEISGLLANAGINTEAISRGRFGRLFDLTKKLDKAELGLLRAQIEHTYKLFVSRVSEGRKLTPEEVDQIGGGRVWTGRQALEHKLVDELGGMREAVRLAARQAGIEDTGSVEVVFYPKEEGLLSRLSELRGGAENLLPPQWSAELAKLGAPALLSAGVQAFTPAVLSIH